MNKPLVISDCDEVLLHMIAPYKDWLGEQHGIDFVMENSDFSKAGDAAVIRRDHADHVVFHMPHP